MESNQKTKSNVERIEKLTALQEGMYFYYEMNPHEGSYHEQHTYRIKGDFRFEYAQTALNLLAHAHDVLRTSFITLKKGEIVQVVLKERKLECSYEKTEKSLEELQQEDIQRGFDLQKDPLLRLKIAEIGEQDYYLLWSFHHIIMDGWCISIIMGDFLRFYNALANGTEEATILKEIQDSLATKPNYGTFLELNAERDKQEALHFWSEMLEGYENVAKIPSLSSSQQESIFQEEEVKIWLSEELTALLQKRAGEAQVTVNTIMEAAWGIVLQQYTHAQDAVFGKVVSGRNADIPGIEQIVGLFINTIPCRVKIEEGESIEALLHKVQSNATRADEFDYAPLAEVQAKSMVGRDLIQTLFVFENYYFNQSAVEVGIQGTEIEILNSREQTGYAITVLVSMSKQISIEVMYDAHRYSAEEIQEILSHYRLVLEEIGRDLKRPAEQIAMCTAAERKQILEQFNDTTASYPQDKTVIDLFEEQVRKTPDKAAVVFEDTKLSYRELNAKANQLARKLRDLGVKPDDFVAMLSERSLEMIIGIYGILKAGGAYVPIDPSYPEDRIQYMLEDCRPKAVLTYHAEIKTDIPVIDLADDQIWTGASYNLKKVNKPGDLVYCIYTSGTSGKPKGVMIRNRGLINRIMWMHKKYPLRETDAILQKTTYTFDVSVWEILWWGMTGAHVVLLKPGGEKDPAEILHTVKEQNVTHMHFVPSMLSVFLMELEASACETEGLSSLKYVFSSGEALGVNQLEKFNQLIRGKTGARLINLYGPTEASIDVTYFDCEYDYRRIPIGKPIDNIRIYILNGQNLCGIGIPGELCIAGVGVAKGYLNRPELTAEKFIDNPYGEGKLYRTGDLARWLPDGNIEYLGRIDEQVKIRGFRIELGEIESSIRKIEGIKDCAVIARADANGEKAIYAYLVSDQEISVNKIRDKLAKTLPDYMIPPYMAQIEQIPVTRNGKLDKRALPEIEGRSEREYIAPRNTEEEAVCAAFSDILGVERVGVKDNFFELGGNSLKVISLINEIESQTGYKPEMNQVFRNPSVEMLAAVIRHSKEEAAEDTEKEYETLSQFTKGNGSLAIICFPFAGGYDSSYWVLSGELHKRMPNAAIYSLKRANWEEISFETAKKEISEIVEMSENVVFYTHCGGSGMALRIYQNLEDTEKIKHIVIGASIPKKPKNRIQKWLISKKPENDNQLIQTLTNMGFQWDDVSDEMRKEIVEQFRKDRESCTKDLDGLYKATINGVSCTAVVGDADPDIPKIDLVQPLWNRYFENPVELVVLPGANHYFHKERAGEVADIIENVVKTK